MEPGDVVEVDTTAIAHGGVCVARWDGRVVFVADAIPGERLRVRITDVRRTFARAVALEVTRASPHRRPHVWPAASIDTAPERRPGGADFGHIALAEQRELKQRVLTEAFERFAGYVPRVAVRAAGPRGGPGAERDDGLRWRTRVGVHVDRAGRAGPFAARSHDVIPVQEYPLATAEIERVIAGIGGAEPGRVDLVQPADGAVRVLHRPDGPARTHRRRGRTGRAQQKPPAGSTSPRATVVERVGDREFRVDAGGFWQVHRLAAVTLDDAVRRALRRAGPDADGRHLDLYGGVGLFAAALAEEAGPRVTTVESAHGAVRRARGNLADLPAVDAVADRVDRYLARVAAEAGAAERTGIAQGVTLLDPPRAGAGREVIERIAGLGPAAVLYVACDPVALARDAGYLRAHGYRTDLIDGIDLFPHSHHVEAVALLRR